MTEEESTEGGEQSFGDVRDNHSGHPDDVLTMNVAYMLADALEAWAVPMGIYPENQRGFETHNFLDLPNWRRQTRLMDLVRQVDSAVEALGASGRNTRAYQRALPKWYAGAYAATVPFMSYEQGQDRAVCTDGDIDLLHSLGDILDARMPFDVTRGQVDAMMDRLGEVHEMLQNDIQGIPDDIRMHLWDLVTRASTVLRYLDATGPEAARRVMTELGGVMITQAVNDEIADNPVRAKRFRELGAAFLVAFVGGAGGQTFTALSSGVAGVIGG